MWTVRKGNQTQPNVDRLTISRTSFRSETTVVPKILKIKSIIEPIPEEVGSVAREVTIEEKQEKDEKQKYVVNKKKEVKQKNEDPRLETIFNRNAYRTNDFANLGGGI